MKVQPVIEGKKTNKNEEMDERKREVKMEKKVKRKGQLQQCCRTYEGSLLRDVAGFDADEALSGSGACAWTAPAGSTPASAACFIWLVDDACRPPQLRQRHIADFAHGTPRNFNRQLLTFSASI